MDVWFNHDVRTRRLKMYPSTLKAVTIFTVLLAAVGFAAAGEDGPAAHRKLNKIASDEALKGVPLDMSPEQLPSQFKTQLRGDVQASKGIAILRQNGSDVEYTFAWMDMTSPVISGHFHKAPHGQVGVRAYSICGVANESPACPTGKRASISGVWKNADIGAFEKGEITIAFHTEKYPAPVGEIAVYIPAKQ
jgi:hypothetical protein